ncbi:MAG: hypothetical protein QXH19_01840 [Candidatus Bathyarchaeia archaeon]
MCVESEKNNLDSPKKVAISDLSNFQFHAAYLAYSEAYDKTTDPEVREFLNQNIIALQQNKIDYQTFYRNISQYRQVDVSQLQNRVSIRTQSKSEWRNRMKRIERERRYEK